MNPVNQWFPVCWSSTAQSMNSSTPTSTPPKCSKCVLIWFHFKLDVIPNIFIHSIYVWYFLINKWLKIIIRAATDWFSEDVQTAGSGRPTEITCEILSSMMRASCFNLCDSGCSPPQPCNTVDSDAAAGLLPELQLQQVQPIVHDLVGGRSSIVKRPILEKKRGNDVICPVSQKSQNKRSVRAETSCRETTVLLGRGTAGGGFFLFLTGYMWSFYKSV